MSKGSIEFSIEESFIFLSFVSYKEELFKDKIMLLSACVCYLSLKRNFLNLIVLESQFLRVNIFECQEFSLLEFMAR